MTLPMISQSLMSAWLLTFTLSLDDVVLSAFLSGPGSTTMPLVIFSRARLGLNPSVNAVATLIVLVVAIGVLAASYMIARAERKRARDLAERRARLRPCPTPSPIHRIRPEETPDEAMSTDRNRPGSRWPWLRRPSPRRRRNAEC